MKEITTIYNKVLCRAILGMAMAVIPATGTLAGGGLVLEDDVCIIRIDFYSAHFTAYQPNTSGNTQFCRDLDGDGDPDEIHIRLEVAELNGGSALVAGPVTQYEIAPGIRPGLWVFSPKFVGMAVENFGSRQARRSLRLPSPAIRIEQGDKVRITLENTHYMPHTLHLHGADHGFVDAGGEGNDGVPLTSENPVMPGDARTYELSPRHAGTMFYHCHVQPHVHVMMGLQGLFIIEENRPDNWLQTMNIGAGLVRAPSRSTREDFDREYDLHYLDLDKELGERIQRYNDPRLITRSMHRDYDVSDEFYRHSYLPPYAPFLAALVFTFAFLASLWISTRS